MLRVFEGPRYDRERTRFSVEHTTVEMYGGRERRRERSGRRKEEEDAVGGGGEDNPMRARWNENAVTRNKRGDPKLLVEVQPRGWE